MRFARFSVGSFVAASNERQSRQSNRAGRPEGSRVPLVCRRCRHCRAVVVSSGVTLTSMLITREGGSPAAAPVVAVCGVFTALGFIALAFVGARLTAANAREAAEGVTTLIWSRTACPEIDPVTRVIIREARHEPLRLADRRAMTRWSRLGADGEPPVPMSPVTPVETSDLIDPPATFPALVVSTGLAYVVPIVFGLIGIVRWDVSIGFGALLAGIVASLVIVVRRRQLFGSKP
jgi:hypothetical protein